MNIVEEIINTNYQTLLLNFKSFEEDILENGKENISGQSEVFLEHLIECNHYDTYGLKLYIDSLETVYKQRLAFSSHMKNQIIIFHTSKKINEDKVAIDNFKYLMDREE